MCRDHIYWEVPKTFVDSNKNNTYQQALQNNVQVKEMWYKFEVIHGVGKVGNGTFSPFL